MKRENANISQLLRNYFESNGMGYWHWFENSWLVADTRNNKTAADIRQDIQNIAPSDQFLVFKIDNNQWSGRGVTAGEKNMFTWLHETWD